MKGLQKIKWKKLLSAFLWILLGVSVLFLMSAAHKKKASQVCTGFYIDIEGATNNVFIDKNDIKNIICSYARKKLVGTPIAQFNLEAMEKELKKDVWLNSAALFFDNNGVLRAHVEEREPLARVFTTDGNTFYIDNCIRILPLSNKHTARLPVFTNCSINEKKLTAKDSSLLYNIQAMSLFIQKDSFLMSMIDQVDINKNQEFEIIPKMGNQQVIFGDSTNMNQKFQKFKLFYKKIIPQYGWNKYSKINLQYKNQVVANIRGIEEVREDSLRAIAIMKAMTAYATRMSTDSTQTIIQDNANNSTDFSIIQSSIERNEEEVDSIIQVYRQKNKSIPKQIKNKPHHK